MIGIEFAMLKIDLLISNPPLSFSEIFMLVLLLGIGSFLMLSSEEILE